MVALDFFLRSKALITYCCVFVRFRSMSSIACFVCSSPAFFFRGLGIEQREVRSEVSLSAPGVLGPHRVLNTGEGGAPARHVPRGQEDEPHDEEDGAGLIQEQGQRVSLCERAREGDGSFLLSPGGPPSSWPKNGGGGVGMGGRYPVEEPVSIAACLWS